jgi:tryptophanyl-tRNA synthetase
MSKPVILTGLRANNELHIGNYFGALLPIIDMARKRSGDYQINLFIPDLHSITTPVDYTKLPIQVINNLKQYVASGLPLDHADVFVYRQSFVPAHSELAWILECFTGIGEMSRMTQFKDKVAGLNDERVNLGLFNYPALMASDILLYGAHYIPVGDDQTQHLEFARDIAERMNNRFGNLFVVPKPVKEQHEFFGKDQGLRIRDLSDPAKKMSKSDATGKGVIFLGDDPGLASQKIMSAETDSFSEIRFDLSERPGISNILQILALLRNSSLKEVIAEWEGKQSYGDLKSAVAEAMRAFLLSFQNKLTAVNNDKLMSKLSDSEAVMNKQANATLANVQHAVGLRP